MARLRRITIVERAGRGFVVEYRDEGGKRPRPAFKTLDDAERFVRHLRGEKPPEIVGKDALTLKEAIRTYMKNCDLSVRGKKTAKSHFESFWMWASNDANLTYLSEIQLIHLDEFKSLQRRRGLSPNSIRRMFATYSAFFNKHVAWGSIAKSPTDGFEKPQEVEANIKVWTKAQIENVWEALPAWAQDAVYFLERTGVRPVDVERMTWGDLDLEASVVRVWSFKGRQSRRDEVPLAGELVEWLGHRKWSRKPSKRELVFLTPRKNAVTADSLQDTVRRAAESLGYEGLTIYGLRHTFADSLVNLNIHPRDIQLLMRHRKFETTTRYTKRKNDHLKRVVDARAQAVTTRIRSQLGHNVDAEGTSDKTKKDAKPLSNRGVEIGAGDRARTDDLYLGKVKMRAV